MGILSRIANFIDGAYLDHTLRDEFNAARLDYQLLAEWMATGIDLLRTYYYNCLPYQSSPPTIEESQRFSQAQGFHRRLQRLSRFEVRDGKLEFRGMDANGKPIFVQKRVDIQIGVDLVLLAAKHQVTHAALLSGDSDLLPAVQVAKAEGVLIHLYHGTASPPHTDLWEAADERTRISQDIVNRILRPARLAT